MLNVQDFGVLKTRLFKVSGSYKALNRDQSCKVWAEDIARASCLPT